MPTTTFWHLVGAQGQNVNFVQYATDASQLASKSYLLTKIGVSSAAANQALATSALKLPAALLEAGGGATTPIWGSLGPNCTTAATQVLASAGVSVPAFARTPMLLYAGVNYGWGAVMVVTSPTAAIVPGAVGAPK